MEEAPAKIANEEEPHRSCLYHICLWERVLVKDSSTE